jgi:hypothetical protein
MDLSVGFWALDLDTQNELTILELYMVSSFELAYILDLGMGVS